MLQQIPGAAPPKPKQSGCNTGHAGNMGSVCWVGKIPLRRAWQLTPVFLPEESQGKEEPGGLQSIESQRVGRS